MKRTVGLAASILLLSGFAFTGCQKDAEPGGNEGASLQAKNNGNNGNNGNGNNGNNGNGNNGNNGGTAGCNTCYYGQGYWFANGNHTWPDVNGTTMQNQNVTVGNHHYSQQEGQMIWNTSNSGGKKDAKKAYTMIASMKLSNYCGSYTGYPSGSGHQGGHTGYMMDMQTVENWMHPMGELSSSNMPSAQMPSHVKHAYERLKSWMEMKECEDDDDHHDD